MITIHECRFPDIRCDAYNCQNHRGYRKYYVGRVDGPIDKATFCEPCLRHMLANLPADFADVEQADHIAQSKAELEVVQAEKQALQAKISEMESNFRKQYMQLLSSQAAPAVEEKVEKAPKEEKTTKTYRCLDCGEDFKTSIQLATHKRTKHKGD